MYIILDLLGSRSSSPKVCDIQSTMGAFAALREDGSVVCWGDPEDGGDCSPVRDELRSSAEMAKKRCWLQTERSPSRVRSKNCFGNFKWVTHVRFHDAFPKIKLIWAFYQSKACLRFQNTLISTQLCQWPRKTILRKESIGAVTKEACRRFAPPWEPLLLWWMAKWWRGEIIRMVVGVMQFRRTWWRCRRFKQRFQWEDIRV